MDNDENYFRKLATQKQLSYNFVIKEHKLLEMLSKLASLPIKTVLKGGTALNQVYFGDFQRFSEDLDFDVFENITVDLLKMELKKLDIEVKKTFYRPGIIGFEISYVAGDTKDIVKVEFNIEKKQFLKNKAILKIANSNIANFVVANVNVYPLETLVVQKLLALVNRNDGKDYYDLFFAFKIVDLKKIKEELKFWAQKKVVDEQIVKKALEKVKTIDNKILKRTNVFIPADKRIDWCLIKNELELFLNKIK